MNQNAREHWLAGIREAAPLCLTFAPDEKNRTAKVIWERIAETVRAQTGSKPEQDGDNPDIISFEEFLKIIDEGFNRFLGGAPQT